MTGDNTLITSHGINRRDFMKLCAALAATMGLSSKAAAEMAESVSNPQRPPVIWIGAQECTGCTESLLRATHPTVENLVLETISLEYHEVLSAAFGHQVEENKHNALEKYKGQYVLVVDGSIPLKDNGIYCMVAGEPIVDHIRKAADGAAAIIAIGSCSAWGGVAAAGVNPTGAVSLQEVLPGKTVINIPGCPPNPHNFLATVAHIITYGTPPKLDAKNRPTFAYGRLIHEHCERRPHFDAGRFAKEFGDEGHRQGWCLYHLGCKGPETWGNCSTLQFCDVGGVWPVAIGHPCYGCNEEGIGFHKGIHQLAHVENQTPRSEKPDVNMKEGGNISAGAVGLLGGVSVMAVRELGRQQKKDNADSRGE
ncbi:TPA: hydrogenase 2 small subunit [Salmonella enterica subsp. enterica serovar Paratyphi B]|uniref:hydrogenase 2 small subunit n=1 Tax=Salmonella enterica TaxID=28901 RepID=UPI0012CA10FA|nr:hydrogenase 2 small subunit [Salmonella enterica]ECU7332568.1 hydrogenase 2 small subunit [Salmonella enterica subsp. enterica serovar Heidelberg]EEJ0071904.1 hydrogenase 2 small subunit [Salmonella enterica subsp. enterica serovar Lille]HAB5026005.1 hydrogenase 2 small subunit [Salmonella enterica subsp. enterica]HCM9075434.1 hydrogenase 2 small subunit [Salmonella enterica subsp. enterica serovar Paratyphi B]NYO02086.1 hydrogenase 2 small subunit [Salmonella enterica subsp. enterica serov